MLAKIRRIFLRASALLLLSLGCSEIVLRLALPLIFSGIVIHGDTPREGLFRLSSNPILAYEMPPNAKCLPPVCPVPFFTNRHGFRDDENGSHADLSKVDVAVLGDSVTVGQSVPFEGLYWVILGNELRSFDPPRSLHLAGLAVSGYETSQELELYRQHRHELNPKLVLLSYVLNDRFEFSEGLARWQLDPPMSVVAGALHRAYVFVRDRYLTFRPRVLFKEFKKISQEASFRPVIVLFPYDSSRTDEYPFATEHRLVREAAEGAGLPVIDLLECLGATAHPSFDPSDEVHPNATGHLAAGRCLAKELAERGLL
jgi:lysophospholipase L1-like esterase